MTATAPKEPTTSTIVINTLIVDGKCKRQLTAKVEDQLNEACVLLSCLAPALPEEEYELASEANERITKLLTRFQPAKRKKKEA